MTMVAGIGSPGPSSGYGSSEEDRASSFSSRSPYFSFGSSSDGGRGSSTGPPSPVSPPTDELSCGGGLEFPQLSTDSDETGFEDLPDILSMGDLDFVDQLISLDPTLNTNDRDNSCWESAARFIDSFEIPDMPSVAPDDEDDCFQDSSDRYNVDLMASLVNNKSTPHLAHRPPISSVMLSPSDSDDFLLDCITDKSEQDSVFMNNCDAAFNTSSNTGDIMLGVSQRVGVTPSSASRTLGNEDRLNSAAATMFEMFVERPASRRKEVVTLASPSSRDVVRGGRFRDVVLGGVSRDVVLGGASRDVVLGSSSSLAAPPQRCVNGNFRVRAIARNGGQQDEINRKKDSVSGSMGGNGHLSRSVSRQYVVGTIKSPAANEHVQCQRSFATPPPLPPSKPPARRSYSQLDDHRYSTRLPPTSPVRDSPGASRYPYVPHHKIPKLSRSVSDRGGASSSCSRGDDQSLSGGAGSLLEVFLRASEPLNANLGSDAAITASTSKHLSQQMYGGGACSSNSRSVCDRPAYPGGRGAPERGCGGATSHGTSNSMLQRLLTEKNGCSRGGQPLDPDDVPYTQTSVLRRGSAAVSRCREAEEAERNGARDVRDEAAEAVRQLELQGISSEVPSMYCESAIGDSYSLYSDHLISDGCGDQGEVWNTLGLTVTSSDLSWAPSRLDDDRILSSELEEILREQVPQRDFWLQQQLSDLL